MNTMARPDPEQLKNDPVTTSQVYRETISSSEEAAQIRNAMNAIEEERRYQEVKYPNHSHTLGEWIMIMRKCTRC